MQRIRGGTARTRAALVVLCLLLVGSTTAPRAADPGKYHTYQELTAALNSAVAAHKDIARIVSIGKTGQGRDIWAVEIANPAGTPPNERPALLVAGNFEGDHVVGSELALGTIEYLLTNYATDATVKQRVDSQVFYVIPRVNADGAELMFAAVKTGRKTNATSFDADNDGRADEDGPEDLNKDGVITVMRVKDPKGRYMIDPADPRLMKKADPAKGEQGGYAIYWEGTDKDHDGFIAEDGPGGADINRNFMHQYPYFQPDAGRYMVSEAETRAVLDYVLKRRNIAAILTFGESDNLVVAPNRRGELGAAISVGLMEFANESIAGARHTGMIQDVGGGFGGRGGGMMMAGEYDAIGGRGGAQAQGGRGGPGRSAATTINPADIDYFIAVSEKYREITGVRTALPVRAPAGAFFEYGYYQFGVPSFSTPGWGPALRTGTTTTEALEPSTEVRGGPFVPQGRGGQAGGGQRQGSPGALAGRGGMAAGGETAAGPVYADQRLVRWMDAEKIDGFVKWTPFKHPTLGDVEIGGFKPYEVVNPPADRLAELGVAHGKFAVYLSSLFPHVKVAKTEVTNHGAGLFRIKADIVNTGYLPTSLAHGAVSRSVKPTMVQLGVEPADIIAGNEKTNFTTALAGSGGMQSYEWVIKGKPGATVTLKVVSQKGGTDTATLKLQ